MLYHNVYLCLERRLNDFHGCNWDSKSLPFENLNGRVNYWLKILFVFLKNKFSITHGMKILLSVNWNISKCPLNAQNAQWNPDFRHCSVTIQWSINPTEICWIASTFLWPFSFCLYFQRKIHFIHQIRGCKDILLWITRHGMNF